MSIVCMITPGSGKADESYGSPPSDMATHLDRLVRAYPDWIAGSDRDHLSLKDGQQFAISDGKTSKSFEEMLEQPDIDDMFFAPYPAGSTPRTPILEEFGSSHCSSRCTAIARETKWRKLCEPSTGCRNMAAEG
jgi:hypothetical protein